MCWIMRQPTSANRHPWRKVPHTLNAVHQAEASPPILLFPPRWCRSQHTSSATSIYFRSVAPCGPSSFFRRIINNEGSLRHPALSPIVSIPPLRPNSLMHKPPSVHDNKRRTPWRVLAARGPAWIFGLVRLRLVSEENHPTAVPDDEVLNTKAPHSRNIPTMASYSCAVETTTQCSRDARNSFISTAMCPLLCYTAAVSYDPCVFSWRKCCRHSM